jgi:hypothetical protein
VKRAIAILLVLSATAHAEDKAGAERYFRAGSAAYSAQDFAAAATDFDEAFKAMPLPEIAFSAAQAYRRLYAIDAKPEYIRRSVELYRVYVGQVKTGGRVGDAADSLAELERELVRLNIKMTEAAPVVEHTRLGVSVTIAGQADAGLHEVGDTGTAIAAGLHATLDGKPIAPFALIDVDAREHELAVTADGYLPAEKNAVAVTGQSQLIELELRAKPAIVTVKTEEGSHISIDGRVVPTTKIEIPAGKHLVAITHRGREPFGKELVAQRGETLTLNAPLRETSRRKAVPYVLFSAGLLAAGAITTSIFALQRDSHASDLHTSILSGNQLPSVANDYDSAVTSRDHFVTATWILGGAAIAAGATGALLYLFDEPSAESLQITPLVNSSGGGAVFSGRF